MGKKMKNAPVYYALAQTRFNTVAALDTYVAAIQERFRKAGYPDFRTLQTVQLTLGGAIPKTATITQYLFLNASKTSGFTLDQSALTHQTTDYDTFQPFTAALLQGLGIVHGEVTLSYSERVGARFLDAIAPRSGESVSDYLQPYVLGLSNVLPERKLVNAVSETRTALGKTKLVARAIIQTQKKGTAGFPEDLGAIQLELNQKFSEIEGTYAILDTDSWIEDRQGFDLKALENTLELLHVDVRRAFDLMVTPHALSVWD